MSASPAIQAWGSSAMVSAVSQPISPKTEPQRQQFDKELVAALTVALQNVEARLRELQAARSAELAQVQESIAALKLTLALHGVVTHKDLLADPAIRDLIEEVEKTRRREQELNVMARDVLKQHAADMLRQEYERKHLGSGVLGVSPVARW